ncbi:MAG: transporter substrate-binding domain-containing protein [Nitrospirales bacterium]|nr:transporter substrate-binding domain-containing protein [Nitrospira sp.]MDR4502228.1 transporter substrate-binding domain-containing protein [Nitrospirales bacterium]
MNILRIAWKTALVLLLLAICCVVVRTPPMTYAENHAQEPNSILKNVLKQGTLEIGVSLFTPWTLRDAKGELVGFDIDVAKQLAKDLGVQPKFHVLDWEDILPALLHRKIDIIIAGMVITPARALKVNFSQPYVESGIGLATNIELTRSFSHIKDLNRSQVTLAAVTGTVADELARRIFPKANVQTFTTSEQAKNAVTKGTVHGYIEHEPLPTFLTIDYPGKVDQPLSKPLLTTKAGFAINKGDADFINFLNAWITAREADTWLASAHKYWFQSLEWRTELGVKE